ncbi:hypothetical protein GFV16_19115 [Bacillus megaterium]|uniref:hypothetical protein n=1 Tax=Priestia megaterium TaxID=1404 RepID=UPI0012930179|nr:hypothetical protein [Priestia megaterium]MQR88005.1 hypothetical protein [Priestia megaterium]
MALFKGDAIKRVNKLLDKGEKRRTKLQENIEKLQEDVNLLYQAVQDDFNEAILEDKELNKKLQSDLDKVRGELQTTQFQLSQIDAVIQSEMEKQKDAIDEERKDYVKDKGEEFRELFHEMNDLKLAYLNKVIEYTEKKKAYNSNYSRTFRDIEKRVGLTRRDPRDDFKLNLNQRYQMDGHYSPMMYNDELRDALMDGKLTFVTNKNKDTFKK